MFFDDLWMYLDNNCIEYEKDFKIASYVSMRVGGIAIAITYPDTTQKLCNLLNFIDGKIKYYLLGNGTNCYFAENYDGIIISTKKLDNLQIHENRILADCGISLTKCAICACENSLSGLEFAYGIPGTVGGGIYMNASAFGTMLSDCVKKSTVYDIYQRKIRILKKEEMMFGVKQSLFMNKNYIVLNAEFELSFTDKEKIESVMDNNLLKRILTQPLEFPNSGSVFKRPKNAYASELIDRAGLKGFSIGNAEISQKHAGFIINKGNATSKEINLLIEEIKKIVKEKFNVQLEEEIIFVE